MDGLLATEPAPRHNSKPVQSFSSLGQDIHICGNLSSCTKPANSMKEPTQPHQPPQWAGASQITLPPRLSLRGNPHHSGLLTKVVDLKHTPSLLSVARSVISCKTILCKPASPALPSSNWARHFRTWWPKKAALVLRGMALLRITWGGNGEDAFQQHHSYLFKEVSASIVGHILVMFGDA